MQRILIVSDTHKRLGNLYEALEKEGSVDAMIHLGDLEGDEDIVNEMIPGPVYMVPGNNDYYSQAPRELEIQLAGKKCTAHARTLLLCIAGFADHPSGRNCKGDGYCDVWTYPPSGDSGGR